MIHADLSEGAEAMVRTLRISQESLPELIPLLAVALAITQHELVIHLWRKEADG